MAMIGDTRGQNTYNTTGATFQLIGNLLQGEKNARGTKPRTLDFVLNLGSVKLKLFHHEPFNCSG